MSKIDEIEHNCSIYGVSCYEFRDCYSKKCNWCREIFLADCCQSRRKFWEEREECCSDICFSSFLAQKTEDKIKDLNIKLSKLNDVYIRLEKEIKDRFDNVYLLQKKTEEKFEERFDGIEEKLVDISDMASFLRRNESK